MCVLLFNVFKHLLLRKTNVLETCWKSKFLGTKIWRNALALKGKRYKVYWGRRLFWLYYLQLSFVSKTVSQISFKFFVREIKHFNQSSLGNEVDFRNITKFWNFKKLRHGFVDGRALITTTLISSCH